MPRRFPDDFAAVSADELAGDDFAVLRAAWPAAGRLVDSYWEDVYAGRADHGDPCFMRPLALAVMQGD